MAYQVLARKYRPLRFSDVVGQDHVTRTLQNALEQNRIAHGYIFSGHRGIGKTTIARILASALNCQNTIGSAQRPTPEPCLVCDSCREIRQGNAVDVIEIDAATNRGIDEIRELRDAARYRPARDRFKIYILDEAHQITDAAFNALLKTLEEPPDHIVFMMATTEPENIPQTIRSRCQHFSFHAVKLDDILGQLRKISADEGVLADEAALDLLAEAGDGSMRDALSIMDQAIASAPSVDGKPQLSAAEIRDLMGTVPNTVYEELLEHVADNHAAGVLSTAGRLLDAGNSPAQIARQFVRYLRNCVVAKIANLTPESADTELLQISPDERRRAARSSSLFTEEELTRFLQVMLRTFDDLGFRQEQRFHLELGLLKLVHLQRLLPMEQFLSQLPRPTNTPPRPPVRRTPAAPVETAKAIERRTERPTPPAPVAAETSQSQSEVQKVTAQPATALLEQTTLASPVAPPVPLTATASPSDPEKVRLEPVAPADWSQDDELAAERPTHSLSSAVNEAPSDPASATGQPAQALSFRPERSEAEKPAAFFPTPDATETSEDKRNDTSEQTAIDDLPLPDPEATEPASTPFAAAPETVQAATDLQTAAVEALFAAKSHNSAAEQLEETTWAIAEGEVRIQTSLSKQLAATIFRPEVEAIIKGVLRNKGLTGVKLVFLPGNLQEKPKAAKKPRTGSAQAKALEHPTVQAAQRLFNAEITNVFDLRRD